jgi:hypothetical protein
MGLAYLPGKIKIAFSKIEELEKDPEKLSQMDKNSRLIAEKFFTKEQAIQKLTQVIQPHNGDDPSGHDMLILTA